jgi:hypothetical protein
MLEILRQILRYKRIGLLYEKMELIIDEITYTYEVAFKIKELNRFEDNSLV